MRDVKCGLIALCIIACGACDDASGPDTHDAGVDSWCGHGGLIYSHCEGGHYVAVGLDEQCNEWREDYWCYACCWDETRCAGVEELGACK